MHKSFQRTSKLSPSVLHSPLDDDASRPRWTATREAHWLDAQTRLARTQRKSFRVVREQHSASGRDTLPNAYDLSRAPTLRNKLVRKSPIDNLGYVFFFLGGPRIYNDVRHSRRIPGRVYEGIGLRVGLSEHVCL